MPVYLCVSVQTHVCASRDQPPGVDSTVDWEQPDMGAGNPTWVFWKNSNWP